MPFSAGSHLLHPVSLGWGITNKPRPEHMRAHPAPQPTHNGAPASPQPDPSTSPFASPPLPAPAHPRPNTRFSPPPLSLPLSTPGQMPVGQTPGYFGRPTTTPTHHAQHAQAVPQRSATCGTRTNGTHLRSRSPMGLHIGTLGAPRPSIPLGAAQVPAHIAADRGREVAHAGGGSNTLVHERPVSRALSSTIHECQGTKVAGVDGHANVPRTSAKDDDSPRDTVWKRLFANMPKEETLYTLTCPRAELPMAQAPSVPPSPRDAAPAAGTSRFFSQGCSIPSDLDLTLKKPSNHGPTSPCIQLRTIDNASGAPRSTYAQLTPFRSYRTEPQSATTPTSTTRAQHVPLWPTLRSSPAMKQRRDSRTEDGPHSTRGESQQPRFPPQQQQQQVPLTPQQPQAREAYPPSPAESVLQPVSSANGPRLTQVGNQQHGKPNTCRAEQDNGTLYNGNGNGNGNGTKPSAMPVTLTRIHGDSVVHSGNGYVDHTLYADLNYGAPADDLTSKIKELQLAKDEHRRVAGLGNREPAPETTQPRPPATLMPTSDAPTTYVNYLHTAESPRTPTASYGAVHQPDPPLTPSNASQHHYPLASNGHFTPSSTHSNVAHHALPPTQLLQPSTTGNAYDQQQQLQTQHQLHQHQQPRQQQHQQELLEQQLGSQQYQQKQQQRRQPQQQQRPLGMEPRLAAPPPVANSRQQRQTLESRNSLGSDSRSSQRSSLSTMDTRAKLLKDAQRSRPLRELAADITRHRIRELRSFQRPHALVQKVVRMFVSVVTNRDATLENWGNLKRTLGGAAFLDSVSQFDVKRLSPMICEVLHDFCEQGVFDVNTLFDVAPSIIPFAQWCEAVAKLNSAIATQNEQHTQNGHHHIHMQQDTQHTTPRNVQQNAEPPQHVLHQDARHTTPYNVQQNAEPPQHVLHQDAWHGEQDGQDDFAVVEEAADEPSEPDLFDPGFIITPEIEKLNEDELANVDLSVSVPLVGKIVFAEPVDLRGWTRDDIRRNIQLNIGEVVVYPDLHDKPPPGAGLNRQATITLYQCYPPKQQDPTSSDARARYETKIKRMTEQKGARFISYNADDGEWVFAVDNF
eukprot:GEMP01005101.1.p1 GENE.GEMP01005101.1~~GEMP01005101.1.p1  ORF type:complete len:1080 (+),score=243.69 GEMP01005101.1:60-3299(+)